MATALAKKLPVRVEHTGSAPQDRAQLMAQQVGKAHEITKAVVQALANSAYAELAANTTLSTTFTYTTLLTLPITTVLAAGFLDITFTASFTHLTAVSSTYFRLIVDGVSKKGLTAYVGTVGTATSVSMTQRVAVTRGLHTVVVQWSTDAASARINATSTVEEHASLRLQEAP